MTAQFCVDCDSELELGFLPDLTHGGVAQTKWHKGEVEETRFLGMKIGLKYDQRALVPITAFRCTNCGLLKFFANVSAEE